MAMPDPMLRMVISSGRAFVPGDNSEKPLSPVETSDCEPLLKLKFGEIPLCFSIVNLDLFRFSL